MIYTHKVLRTMSMNVTYETRLQGYHHGLHTITSLDGIEDEALLALSYSCLDDIRAAFIQELLSSIKDVETCMSMSMKDVIKRPHIVSTHVPTPPESIHPYLEKVDKRVQLVYIASSYQVSSRVMVRDRVLWDALCTCSIYGHMMSLSALVRLVQYPWAVKVIGYRRCMELIQHSFGRIKSLPIGTYMEYISLLSVLIETLRQSIYTSFDEYICGVSIINWDVPIHTPLMYIHARIHGMVVHTFVLFNTTSPLMPFLDYVLSYGINVNLYVLSAQLEPLSPVHHSPTHAVSHSPTSHEASMFSANLTSPKAVLDRTMKLIPMTSKRRVVMNAQPSMSIPDDSIHRTPKRSKKENQLTILTSPHSIIIGQ